MWRKVENLNKAIVVIGMHRSGTSAMTGCLKILGVDLGDRVSGPMPDNVKGEFENQDIVDFERKVLKEAGGSWNNPPSSETLEKSWRNHEKEYEELINHFNRNPYWGFKAVRTSLFPRILLKIPNLYLIYMLRKPRAVAASLRKRNNFQEGKSLELWKIYNERIERFLSKNEVNYLKIEYDDLVDRTEETLRKVIRFLGMKEEKKSMKEIKSFIERGLRHHR